MPSFSQIFSDGFEHLRRSARLAGARNRTKTEKRRLQHALTALGKRSFELCTDFCLALPSGPAVRELSDCRKEARTQYGDRAERVHKALAANRVELIAAGEALRAGKRLHAKAAADKKAAEERLRSAEEGRKAALREELEAKNRELSDLWARLQSSQEEAGRLERESGNLKKEITRTGEQGRERLRDLDAELTRAHAALGADLLGRRPPEPELAELFASVDLSRTLIDSLSNTQRSEQTLLELLDPTAVQLFYIVVGAALLTGLAAIVLVVVLFTVVL